MKDFGREREPEIRSRREEKGMMDGSPNPTFSALLDNLFQSTGVPPIQYSHLSFYLYPLCKFRILRHLS